MDPPGKASPVPSGPLLCEPVEIRPVESPAEKFERLVQGYADRHLTPEELKPLADLLGESPPLLRPQVMQRLQCLARRRAGMVGPDLYVLFHGADSGTTRHLRQLEHQVLEGWNYDLCVQPKDLEPAFRQLACIPPDQVSDDLLRATVHLAQLLDLRWQNANVSEEVRARIPAEQERKLAEGLMAQVEAWSRAGRVRLPEGGFPRARPSQAKLPEDAVATRLSLVDRDLVPPATAIPSPELKAFLSAKKPPEEVLLALPREQASNLLAELVAPGLWMKGSDQLYNLIWSEDPRVRSLVEEVLPQVEQLGTRAAQAGLLGKPDPHGDWVGALFSGILSRHPERVTPRVFDQVAAFLASSDSNASLRARNDMEKACDLHPEYWSRAAERVLEVGRDFPVGDSYELLGHALTNGWNPTPEQAQEILGHTLAAGQAVRDWLEPYGMGRSDAYRACNQGLRVLLEMDRQGLSGLLPRDWKEALLEKFFGEQNGSTGLHPWPDAVVAMARARGPERLMSDLEAQPPGGLDDLTGAGQASLLCLSRYLEECPDPAMEQRLQRFLAPRLLPRVRSQALEELATRAVERFRQEGVAELNSGRLSAAERLDRVQGQLQVAEAYDGRRSWEPREGEWEEFLSAWTAAAPGLSPGGPAWPGPAGGGPGAPVPVEEALFQPFTRPAGAVESSRLLIVAVLPPELVPVGHQVLGQLLREKGAVRPAWYDFLEVVRGQEQGRDLKSGLQQLLLGQKAAPEATSGVAIGSTEVRVGGVRLRVKPRNPVTGAD